MANLNPDINWKSLRVICSRSDQIQQELTGNLSINHNTDSVAHKRITETPTHINSYLATTHSAPQQCAKHIAVIILSQNVPFEGYHASARAQLFVTNVCNATILPYISFPNSHSDTRYAATEPLTNSIHVCEKSADTCSNVIGSREMFAIVFRVAPVFASQPTACLESRHLVSFCKASSNQ